MVTLYFKQRMAQMPDDVDKNKSVAMCLFRFILGKKRLGALKFEN